MTGPKTGGRSRRHTSVLRKSKNEDETFLTEPTSLEMFAKNGGAPLHKESTTKQKAEKRNGCCNFEFGRPLKIQVLDPLQL